MQYGTNKYHKIGSIGKCVPSVKAKLVNVNKDGIGELVVKGPNVMLEYFENKQETKKALVDGWFYTGDLAKIDDEGYIFICGRKKNVIVLKNGKNIYPEEMENLLNRIEGIEESFIFGKQMSNDKNDIKIFAKLVYNQEIIEDAYKVKSEDSIYNVINEKIKEINKSMPRYKAIKGIILTQEPLIKTTTNKIKRQDNLMTKFLGRKIDFFEEIDSTQLEILRRIEKKEIQDGEIVIANIQTNGMRYTWKKMVYR